MRSSFACLALAALTTALSPLVFAVGCSSSNDAPATDTGVDTGSMPPLVPVRWTADCDPIVPYVCGFPFPTSFYLKDDPTTPTKKRVNLKAGMLPLHSGKETDPSTWNMLDGFSPTGNLMTVLPYATVKGLPGHETLDVSLTKDSPTLLIEAETGALVPHWAETDHSVDEQPPRFRDPQPQRTFIIRPVVRLKDKTRYIVAIRNVIDETDGKVIEPPPEASRSCATARPARRRASRAAARSTKTSSPSCRRRASPSATTCRSPGTTPRPRRRASPGGWCTCATTRWPRWASWGRPTRSRRSRPRASART